MDYSVGPVSAIRLSSPTPGTAARSGWEVAFGRAQAWAAYGNNHLDRSLDPNTPFDPGKGSRARRKGREMRPFLRASHELNVGPGNQVSAEAVGELTISSLT